MTPANPPRAIAIVQARMGSTRFPGKSMAEIEGRPILWYLFRQLAHCRTLDAAILATTTRDEDTPLATYAESEGWPVFRGDSADVLDRYVQCARDQGAGPETGIVRLTGDDILTDPGIVDAVVLLYLSFAGRIAFVSTDRGDRLPYGAGVELASFQALVRAHGDTREPADREHVMPYIRRNSDLFPYLEITPGQDMSSMPLSIDHPADLDRNAALIRAMDDREGAPYSLRHVLRAVEDIT